MGLSRRQRAQRAFFRWLWLGLTAVVAVAAVFPFGALVSADGVVSQRLLTSRNCRAILRQGIPLLGVHLQQGAAPAEPPETAETAGRGGLVAWLFSAVTGVSLGQPVSFLTADLPLARTSYAGAIVASGRRGSSSGGSGTTGLLPAAAGPGGGLTPGNQPAQPPSPAPSSGARAGVPGDAVLEDQDAQLYLYGGDKPVIAIVHTHGSESYLPVLTAMARAKDPKADVSKLESFTTDNSANMLRVGEELARYLATTHGIPVVQSRRLHDRQEDGFRLGAYERSLETMTEILRRYPSVQIMLDLHRDSPSHDKTTTLIKGVPTATICVIVGTDNLLDNPEWRANYDFARRLVATMEQNYPGLSRGILVRDERYNQHVMNRTMLLEIGGQENTLEEVFAAVHALGEVLAQIVAEGFD